MSSLYARRRAINALVIGLSLTATGIGIMWLVLILGTLLANGLTALSLDIFTQTTPPPGSKGGLANAIFGSAAMTFVGVIVGAPVGILAGTFLAEFGRYSRVAPVIRFVNDILLSAP